MATIIPFGTYAVGNATVNLSAALSAGDLARCRAGGGVHKVYLQADPANTVQVDIKYATKLIATLWKPPTTGALPEHVLTVDENVGNSVDIMAITLTSADAGSDVCGYITIT